MIEVVFFSYPPLDCRDVKFDFAAKIISISVNPISVRIIQKPTVLEAYKEYSVACEASGSHPRAQIFWIEGNSPFLGGKVHDYSNY